MSDYNNQNERHGQTVPVQGQTNAGNMVGANPMPQNLFGESAAKYANQEAKQPADSVIKPESKQEVAPIEQPATKPSAGKPQGGKRNDATPETPPRSKRNDEKATVERSIIGKDNEKIRDFINECPAMMLDSIRVVLHLAAHNGSEDGIAKMDMRIFNAYLNSDFSAADQNSITFEAVRKHRRNRMRELMQKANRFLPPEQKDEIPYIVMDLAEREEFVNKELEVLRKSPQNK